MYICWLMACMFKFYGLFKFTEAMHIETAEWTPTDFMWVESAAGEVIFMACPYQLVSQRHASECIRFLHELIGQYTKSFICNSKKTWHLKLGYKNWHGTFTTSGIEMFLTDKTLRNQEIHTSSESGYSYFSFQCNATAVISFSS